MSRVARAWTRVSTDEQSTEKDVRALRAFAGTLGLEIDHVYDVTGSAYKGEHRAALEQMLTDAEAGKFDVLLITAVNRLSREGGVPTMQILQRLIAAGVAVKSLNRMDIEGEMDFGQEVVAYIDGMYAHKESKDKSAAVRRGMEAARAAGKHVGRPPGRKDGDGVKRDSRKLKQEQARRRLAGIGQYGNQKG